MISLHSIVDRSVLAHLGDWEIRGYPTTSPYHRYFAARGLLHCQRWHPGTGVSILTPSGLTRDRFEIWTPGMRICVREWRDVVAHLDGPPLPGEAEAAAVFHRILRDAPSYRGSVETRTDRA